MTCAVFFLQNHQAQDSDLLSGQRDQRLDICNRRHPKSSVDWQIGIYSGTRYPAQQLCNVSYHHSSVLLNLQHTEKLANLPSPECCMNVLWTWLKLNRFANFGLWQCDLHQNAFGSRALPGPAGGAIALRQIDRCVMCWLTGSVVELAVRDHLNLNVAQLLSRRVLLVRV